MVYPHSMDRPLADPALDTLAQTQPELARRFSAGWDTPAARWAAAQWAPPESPRFEPALRRALAAQLAVSAGPGSEALLDSIEANGVVLTPHHVCPTPGPTFGAIDVLSALGHPGPILVLAWSGVPISNSAVSGALCYAVAQPGDLLQEGSAALARHRRSIRDRSRDGVTEGRLNLVPSRLRDRLLYRCPMPDSVDEVLGSASAQLAALVPRPLAGESYPAWSIRTATAIQRRMLGRDDLWYIDLNEVATRYLLEVLAEPDHPISRLVRADPEGPLAAVSDLSWFYTRRPGKREKVTTLRRCPEALADGLASGAVCPGLVPVFGALRLLSRVHLLGGFRQVCYLEAIADAWLAAGLVGTDQGVPGRLMTGRLTTGGQPVYPLDVALGTVGTSALPGPATPMSTLWRPLLARVAGRAPEPRAG
ncbi:MAG TPA: hypothetical protein ENK18_01270 [Deltaproteobacteria bacterium]|nr:hypothetical protein [Deltaproteobacteria bacterium]